MKKTSKIYVAGHKGLVGSAIIRNLKSKGYSKIITKSRLELDLLNQAAVDNFFATERPEYVFLAAAKVGGIMANSNFKADFIYENIQLQTNIIYAAYKYASKKLLFLGSSCVYPKLSPQPIKEEYLLTGPLEPSNDAYAIAKIAGIAMCQSFRDQYQANFIAVMPTNLYGPNDNYSLTSSHVLPAMIRKFHEAKISGQIPVTLWGTGSAKREFLHVDDLADALVYLMKNYNDREIINIGTGKDLTIMELAEIIQKVVGHKGKIIWDKSKPDGTPRKLLDVSKLHDLGWKHSIDLLSGIKASYSWFIKNKHSLKER
ncbi:MAG: GDP-L-fucose synthase [Candidatus Pacebacteria bacterium]|nr:GDP-L-fucose synthase [Candidatus Paceibacterota bacterium]